MDSLGPQVTDFEVARDFLSESENLTPLIDLARLHHARSLAVLAQRFADSRKMPNSAEAEAMIQERWDSTHDYHDCGAKITVLPSELLFTLGAVPVFDNKTWGPLESVDARFMMPLAPRVVIIGAMGLPPQQVRVGGLYGIVPNRGGRRAEVHGRVIAELNFGFWRYLCEPPYLTSLWVPAVASAFPLHPSTLHPEQVRVDVADRMQRLHFLRNRVAHHEPIHRRDLSRDHGQLLELVGWMCSESRYWVAATSRTPEVIAARPEVANGEAGR